MERRPAWRTTCLASRPPTTRPIASRIPLSSRFWLGRWQLCGGGVDLREWKSYDVDRLIAEWGLADQECWAGVDASWTTDLTAVVFVFRPPENRQVWTLLPFFWMPKDRVRGLERVCRVPYSTWIEQGFIEATDGNAIDLRAVMDRIRWGSESSSFAKCHTTASTSVPRPSI